MAAAFLEALLRDEPLNVCLRQGLAAAAITCESEDTVAPTMSLEAIARRGSNEKQPLSHSGTENS